MNKPQKPLSEARLLANRANARKSTGPRTEAGKRRSALNAVTHGLTAALSSSLAATGVTPRDITALGEDRSLLPATIQRFMRSWNPTTPYEASLVKRLAELEVRLDRCTRLETGLLDIDIAAIAETDSHESVNSALASSFSSQKDTFSVFTRYEGNLSRAYERTLKQLLAVRKEQLAPNPEDLHPPARPVALPPPIETDETNPTALENKDLPPAPVPTEANPPDRRLDLHSPVTPIDTQNRRHGAYVRCAERILPPVELEWLYLTRKKDAA